MGLLSPSAGGCGVVYEPGMITKLLPAAFDKQRGWGVRLSDTHVEAGMPRAASDPSQGGTLMAMCADAQRAYWSLEQHERNVVGCRHILGWEQHEVAARMGVSRSRVAQIEFAAVRRMCVRLNGRPLGDGLDEV